MPAQIPIPPEVRRFLRSLDDTIAAAGPTVADVYTRYQDWASRRRAKRTCEWGAKHRQDFLAAIPADLRVADLRGHHVEEWLACKDTWGANHRRGAIVAVTTPLNWALRLGLIDANPVRGVEKPRAKRRESKLTPADFAAALEALGPDDPFRDLLVFAWETGCRPEEARIIARRHVRLDLHRVDIPREEAKGKRRPRLIYLSPIAEEIIRRLLLDARGDGPLFRNKMGGPWKVDMVNCRFGRLKKRLGQRFAAYDFRHAFATRKLKEGHDPITVAHLLGHKDATMLCRHYEELGGDREHLSAAVGQGLAEPGITAAVEPPA